MSRRGRDIDRVVVRRGVAVAAVECDIEQARLRAVVSDLEVVRGPVRAVERQVLHARERDVAPDNPGQSGRCRKVQRGGRGTVGRGGYTVAAAVGTAALHGNAAREVRARGDRDGVVAV